MSSEIEELQVDYMLLADRAEVLNGKVYMMGGGWDRRFMANFESPIELTIVLGILVPWNLTNEKHDIAIRVTDSDGNAVEPHIQASFTTGRPPESVSGQGFRTPMIFRGNWKLPAFGAFAIEAALPDRVLKKIVFYAVERADRRTT